MNGSSIPYIVGSKSFTAVAVNTASKAGEWVKSRLGAIQNVNLKTSTSDLVTEVDKGTETLIRNLIKTHFPTHAILGEEGVGAGSTASAKALQEMIQEEYLWIIDPIDGTTNFVHGFPFFCVSIALAHRGEVIVGVVYDPMLDEMFVAEKGKGAYVKGHTTHVSGEKELSHALVATGFPVDHTVNLPRNMAEISQLVAKVRNIRSGGSAALHLAYVAAGRLSGFWEHGLSAWDIAAGSLLVQESGGVVTDTEGKPFTLAVRNVIATNGHIHKAMISELTEANAAG
ncbi:inositol monophosphatase [Paenibacillus albiflavus]|uniref:Inositol-1-monophosphatase n=1 Tax=Paenibacillus albiflavus TaxID=2545760 RepID=A0A4R4EHN8_9BACL|nr:inositol monophosphatase family protein [Paenibacillus albiflavus]TCZ77685.1 inositol monophosphatase [Paenibacillus albiflavus]